MLHRDHSYSCSLEIITVFAYLFKETAINLYTFHLCSYDSVDSFHLTKVYVWKTRYVNDKQVYGF